MPLPRSRCIGNPYCGKRRWVEERRHQLVAIVETSDDAIISTTLDDTITTGNCGTQKLHGCSSEEAIEQHVIVGLMWQESLCD